jgi:iron complex transport system substrate-binding protein
MRVCLFSAVLVGLLVGLSACGHSTPVRNEKDGTLLHSMECAYATGFSVDYFKGYKRVIVHSPWEVGEEIARYYLTADSSQETPSDGQRILTPVRTLVTASSTHYAFLELLGELDKVVGLCEVKRVYNPSLRTKCATGRIVDLGDPFRMNVERCLLLKPELIMVSGFNQYDENVNRLMAAGMPVVYNNEWMEADVLGRAEWIRFIACFFDKEALADSLFALTEQRYGQLVKLGASVKGSKPLILSGDNFRGTWYQPGGRNFTARLFVDAGGRYLYTNDTTRGSLPLSFEQVYNDLGQADIWVGATGGTSLQELKALDQRYTLFKAFRQGKVYSYTNRVTPQGGNDFWEGAVAHPDSLLADFLHIFHPDLLPEHTFTYLKQLH